MQKLVEAKLKRVYAEGVAERAAGQGLSGQLALEAASVAAHQEASDEGDEASAARADANMAALLAEMDLEGEGCAFMCRIPAASMCSAQLDRARLW